MEAEFRLVFLIGWVGVVLWLVGIVQLLWRRYFGLALGWFLAFLFLVGITDLLPHDASQLVPLLLGLLTFRSGRSAWRYMKPSPGGAMVSLRRRVGYLERLAKKTASPAAREAATQNTEVLKDQLRAEEARQASKQATEEKRRTETHYWKHRWRRLAELELRPLAATLQAGSAEAVQLRFDSSIPVRFSREWRSADGHWSAALSPDDASGSLCWIESNVGRIIWLKAERNGTLVVRGAKVHRVASPEREEVSAAILAAYRHPYECTVKRYYPSGPTREPSVAELLEEINYKLDE